MNTLLTYKCISWYGVFSQIKIADNLDFDFNLQNSNVRLGIYRKETIGGLF